MPSAEIITIGTEILLGEIVDTNARYIAVRLRQSGIDLFRKTTVGDNIQRIAQMIQEALERCDILITTGGLGPTVDDPTRDAVALAMGVPTEYRPELWEQIQARFRRYNRQPTENNRRQAYIPQGALPLENPVGTAPCFIVERGDKSVISLPGVPREMEYLLDQSVLPYLRQRYQITSIIKTRTLHTAGVGESMIDDRIGDLETLSNPTVGLAAHSGQVDVRITAKANSQAEVDALTQPVEDELRRRLGNWIYGVDSETLEQAALNALGQRGWTLAVIESGLSGELIRRLAAANRPEFRGGEAKGEHLSPDNLEQFTDEYRRDCQASVGLGVTIVRSSERQEVYFALVTPESARTELRPYGGPPEYAPRWALHNGLDLIRSLGLPG